MQTKWQWVWSEQKKFLRSPDFVWRIWVLAVMLGGISALMLYRTIFYARPDNWLAASGLTTAFGLGCFLLVRWLRRPQSPVAHAVTILCSRDAGQPEFFLANCDCGWIGETLETEREARADGTGHSTNVRLEVEYPLGE